MHYAQKEVLNGDLQRHPLRESVLPLKTWSIHTDTHCALWWGVILPLPSEWKLDHHQQHNRHVEVRQKVAICTNFSRRLHIFVVPMWSAMAYTFPYDVTPMFC